ncbi:MAG: twin-arginine translocase subunit TatC [Candidatus Methanoperedens sp.]|nr:twin-arginine translocase subunit TatC [Candidatus Methanoperedens sp.]
MMNTVPGDEELPLTEHIEELRSRMIIVAVPVAIIAFIAFWFSGGLLVIWKQTVPVPMSLYSPMESISTKLTLSLVISLFLGIPLIVYEAFKFVGKGLYANEKLFFIKVVPLSFILFFSGATLAYFLVTPLVFKQALLYSGDVAVPQVSVIRAFYTTITLVVGFGIVFQFPLLMIGAMKMGILKPGSLKRQRMMIYGALIALAFFVSPGPEAVSELIVAAALVVLFEFSLIVARFF